MSIKHIAFVVKYFPLVSETFIVNQINGLQDAGYKVSLYAYNQVDRTVIHESLKKYDLLNKVHYFVKAPINKLSRFISFIEWVLHHFFKINWYLLFKCLNVFKYGKDAYTLKLFYEAQWFLIPYNFELIHAHFGMNGNRIAYLKACGILPDKVKLVTTFHGYDLVPNKLKDYKIEYKYLFEEATAFTVNTPYLENQLKQVNSYHKPIYVLAVGLDTNFFKRKTFKHDATFFDLVFCGKLIGLKGPDLAIEIIAKLHEFGYQKVRLHLIGEGNLRHQLEKQVEMSKLMKNVIFYGSLSQDDIKECFEKSDAFILPGRYETETGRAETQGLVIQEAQAMKLPVIVSDVGGMKYGVLPDESGFIIEEENVDGAVKAIEKLILNPKLKIEMGKAGRLLVEENYDTKILVKKLQDIYKVVIDK